MTESFPFEELEKAPLIVDAVYKGGTNKNMSDEVLSKLLPRTENSGGFRKTLVNGKKDEYAYIVLYTTMSESEWPDFMDYESGIFRYYGDNRKPGHELHDTQKMGNKILSELFSWLNDPLLRKRIPPILVFKKEHGRDVRFLGLAVPGYKNYSEDQELIAFWRTLGSNRFQNYEAYFTILDTGTDFVSKDWLKARIRGDIDSDSLAPKVWLEFQNRGRMGIKPLAATKINTYPGKRNQLPADNDTDGWSVLEAIRNRYSEYEQGFETCAVRIVQMMDIHFQHFDVTRPWRDGGRDAIGHYLIGSPIGGISLECSLEAKLYGPNNGVGVKQMSRLISRIKYRQFGVMVTTSYINKQAYDEVKDDGHPIIMITGRDIVEILRTKQITIDNVEEWLDTIGNEIMIDDI